jgi:NADH/F420H2 dehydrogenase subunit C
MGKYLDYVPIHDEQLKKISSDLKDKILKIEKDAVECPIVWILKEHNVTVLSYLKSTTGLEYEFLADLTAIDEMGSKEEKNGRFTVVYNLFSPKHKSRLRVKCSVNDGEEVPTIVSIWKSANWAEREVFDMFGIRFKGHPDLRRILLDIRWEGHPLRKDYPLRKYQLFTEPEPIPMHLLTQDLEEDKK